MGYLLSNQLDLAMVWVKQFGTAVGTVIAVPIVFYAGWRGLALVQMIRRLRLRRDQSSDAPTQTEINGKVAVLDLLDSRRKRHHQSGAIPAL